MFMGINRSLINTGISEEVQVVGPSCGEIGHSKLGQGMVVHRDLGNFERQDYFRPFWSHFLLLW